MLLEKIKMALTTTFIFVSNLLQRHQVKSGSTSTHTLWSDRICYFISSQLSQLNFQQATYFIVCWWYLALYVADSIRALLDLFGKITWIKWGSLKRDKESECLWLPKVLVTMEQASVCSSLHHSSWLYTELSVFWLPFLITYCPFPCSKPK